MAAVVHMREMEDMAGMADTAVSSLHMPSAQLKAILSATN